MLAGPHEALEFAGRYSEGAADPDDAQFAAAFEGVDRLAAHAEAGGQFGHCQDLGSFVVIAHVIELTTEGLWAVRIDSGDIAVHEACAQPTC
jgi:hypothetical protein